MGQLFFGKNCILEIVHQDIFEITPKTMLLACCVGSLQFLVISFFQKPAEKIICELSRRVSTLIPTIQDPHQGVLYWRAIDLHKLNPGL